MSASLGCQRGLEHCESAITEYLMRNTQNYQLSMNQKRCLGPDDSLSKKRKKKKKNCQHDSVEPIKSFSHVTFDLKSLPEVYGFI